MEAFATIDDYTLKYATDMDEDLLAIWLDSASRYMCGEMDASGISYAEPSEDFAASLADVCCDVAHRAIGDVDDDYAIPSGATQVNMTGGSYSRGYSFGTAGYSSMFLTASEKLALGIGRPRACVVSPYGGV